VSGPWEDYAPTAPTPSAGPWEDYAQRRVTPPVADAAPKADPNRVENAVRGFFGAPKVGENPGYEEALSADSPFPDVLPTSPTLLRDIGGALGQGARYLLRGAESNIPSIREAIDTFTKAGTTPSMGQATGGRVAQAAESLLGKYPGGAGVMARKGTSQASEIGRKVTSIADNLSPTATPSTAGRAIEKGLSGEGGFVDRFKRGQQHLYDQVDQFIPAQTRVGVSNTARALASMNQDIGGAEALSRFFKNSKIQGIEGAFRADVSGTRPGVMRIAPNAPTRPGGLPGYGAGRDVAIPGGSPTNQLPYEAVKKLRTLVGDEISNHSLVSDVPKSKWKALYASLSQDMDAAARATGNPAAARAMQRANQFSRGGYDRIGGILDKVSKQDIPEKIFESSVNPADMKAGASKIGAIMKSLNPAERDVVKSAFIRRMGVARAGVQNAEGDVFSPQTFLTNWANMSPQAKDVMFASADGELRRGLNAVAKTAERIKEGAQVFANPSGSGPAIAATGLISGAATAAATGNFGVATSMLGSAAAANLTSRLMTNPKFVNWLAKASAQRSPELARQTFLLLGKAMQGQPQDVKDDANRYAHSALDALGGGQ
jgi:hypothetical protein